jgi:acylglycerol lipase
VRAVELSVEGTRLHAQHVAPDGKAVGAAILLHGFNSALQEFGPLPEALAAAGVHSIAFDQRGFGASSGERGRTGLDRILSEVEEVAKWTRDNVGKNTRIVLIGHSLGACFALGVMARRSGFHGAVAAHPFPSLMDGLNNIERFGYHLIGRFDRRRTRRGGGHGTIPYKVSYRDLFVDADARDAAKQQPFLQRKVNLGNYDFARTMDTTQWASRVRQPVLCIIGTRDRVMGLKAQMQVVDALAGRVDVLEHDTGHSLWLDRDGARVATASADWVRRRLQEKA